MPTLRDIAPNAAVDVVSRPRRTTVQHHVDETGAVVENIIVNTASWTFLTRASSPYDDVEGESYHYLRTTRAANDRVAAGDWALVHRAVDSGQPDAGCIFGVARIGRVVRTGDDRYAMFDRYLPLTTPIPINSLANGDPRVQAQNPINPIPVSVVTEVLARVGTVSMGEFEVPRTALHLDVLREEAAELRLPDAIHLDCLAALRAGKHVILTGPPGTGKSTYALAIGRAAARVGLASGVVMTTGTSDWTTSDTVGGYRLDPSLGPLGGLTFNPGLLLESLTQNAWLVIDELNRADIDKAIGQFFSVLSGQPVTLPFVDDGGDRISIVPPGAESPQGTNPYRVPDTWSLIATMNERDRDLLFTLSEAFMRRFAAIRLAPPKTRADWEWILDHRTSLRDSSARTRLLNLVQAPGVEIGPAVAIDVARFVASRAAIGREDGVAFDEPAAFSAAVEALVGPQLTALFEEDEQRVRRWIAAKVTASSVTSAASTPEGAVDAGDQPERLAEALVDED